MIDLLKNEKPELFRKILIAMVFSALGYCGNYFSLQVAFSVAFIFGSIFSIFAVAIMGMWWGIGVSIIASSYTYLLWNHPYAIIIFTVETLWMGIALKRGEKNILLIDSLYWLFFGIPLIIAFYSGLQQLDNQSVTIIILKQSVNGVFNAMVASIILSHTPLRLWILGKDSTRLPNYSTIIFHLISFSLMVPSLSLLVYMNYRETVSEQSQTMASVQENAHGAKAFIEEWVENHLNAVRVIAGLEEKYPLRPSSDLQKELKQIRELFPDYHNVFLGDSNATTIASDPLINELGESTIGINFADQVWFKQLKNTYNPVISDIFMGRGGIFFPIFSISIPVVRDEKLVSFGLGAVNIERLRNHLSAFSHGGSLSLVDRSGNIVLSTNENRKPLTPFTGINNGTIVTISSEVSLWVPGIVKNVSIMNVWKDAYYFTRSPIDQTNWILITEASVEPMQKYLYSITIWGVGGIAMLYVLSMLLALVLSRRVSGNIESLSIVTKNILLKIDKQDMIDWPHMNTIEMKQLTNNFKDTESALRKYKQEARHSSLRLERKIQERTWELQNERRRLSDILYGTNSGTWEWNVQSGEASFNERWANIIGYSLHELEPINIQSWIDFTHPDDIKVSNRILEKHFKKEIDYYECECRMKHKDGSWVWVLDRGKVVAWTEDGKPLTMSGTHQDITRRKQTEVELKESEQRLTLALTATQDAIWDWNLLANNFYYSPRWWNLLGYEANELKVDSGLLPRLMHPEDLDHARCIVDDAIASGKTSFELEGCLRHKDGHYVPTLTRGLILLDSIGNAVRISGTTTDLTEQKKIEEERKHMDQQRQQVQKAESLSRMAGAIAHHFNNQLYAVIGNLEMAMDDLPFGVNSNENLVSAMNAARKAADVSRLMLTYLGQTPRKHELIDLSEACRQSLSIVQAVIPKGIILNVDFHGSGPILRADEGQINQVLVNLTTNAWESISNNQSTIGLAIRTVDQVPTTKRFPIDWQPKHIPHACLEISDTGCGISIKNIEKIFDPFFTTKFTGRGMGLPVVMGIVKSHGGCITVDSEFGCGSTFRIYLPISTEKIPLPLEPEKPVAALVQKVEKGSTVLLIDDEAIIRNTTKIMLSRFGYTVIEAQDGVEALEIFQQHQNEVCCVISDLTMPRMGGWEALTELRKIQNDVRVILASGHNKDVVMAGDHSEQPQAFLYKPYTMSALKEALAKAMSV